MADFQEILDFPPAPKLDLFGRLDPAKATPAEMRGQEIFFGKGQCSSSRICNSVNRSALPQSQSKEKGEPGPAREASGSGLRPDVRALNNVWRDQRAL
jgi:cytochrome c peroxidase